VINTIITVMIYLMRSLPNEVSATTRVMITKTHPISNG
jgi:hypothetical protein